MMRRTGGAVLAAIATLGLTSAASAQGAASVLVEPVEMREITETAPIIGQLVASVEAEVATRRDGVVERVHFEVGDAVSAGDELVHLDDQLVLIQFDNARAALSAAKAGVNVARARVKLAEQVYQRQSRLKGSTAFSGSLFEDAEQNVAEAQSELARAEAQVAIAEAAVARTEYDARHSVILAPFDGVVISRSAQPGEYMQLGGAVAMLLDVTRLEIEASIPVDLIDGLRPGRALRVMLDEGLELEAEVRTLLPVENVSTRTRPLRLALDVSDVPRRLVADGKSVTVMIPVSDPRQALMAPKDALVQSLGGEWRVFVAEGDKAVPRAVVIGDADGGMLEVLSGLREGELVVVRGNERLRPNQTIAPRRAEPDQRDPAKHDQKSESDPTAAGTDGAARTRFSSRGAPPAEEGG